MTRKLPEVDVVIVGLGWTGGILAKELAAAGLSVAALERGAMRTAKDDLLGRASHDELRHAVRYALMQDPARDTLTVRNRTQEHALPMRRLGSFVPGQGVGGAGTQWSGHTWRWSDREFKARTLAEERHGRAFIPAEMGLQDWGITYAELESCYDRFEYTVGVSGRAGNLGGRIHSGGNPFEAPRRREYPLPPLEPGLAGDLFSAAVKSRGYTPFPRPTAHASEPYVNPDGARLSACEYCGFCDFFPCAFNAKGSPNNTVIPIALQSTRFTVRQHAWVTRVLTDSARQRATGVAYTDMVTGEACVQPASIVILCAYALNNVHLMLLSEIGTPYDPLTQAGVIGKNYCYQLVTRAWLFFEDRVFNPFMAAGGLGTVIDDFNANSAFDSGAHGYIGGFIASAGHASGAPIKYRPVPADTPRWGTAWKAATAKWYPRSMRMSASGSVMPNRWNYIELDRNYRNALGQPLMRLTFDYKENELRLSHHAAQVLNEIGDALQPTSFDRAVAQSGPWSVVPYQSTHNAGGTIMGTNPLESAVNKYCQSWDVDNLFIVGASVFPHNSAYNPTGLAGALAYWVADAIKDEFVRRPGPLMHA
jgi:gluconate 2-dehydrogenase alpha chain